MVISLIFKGWINLIASTIKNTGPWLSKMTTDANPGALEAGLDTTLLFIEMAPSGFTRQYAEKLAANVIDKAFGGRPSTHNKGKAILLKLIEVDEAAPVASVLLTKLNDKKPKVPPGKFTSFY
jgi:hypothetical protein